jgi:hypothetical protein
MNAHQTFGSVAYMVSIRPAQYLVGVALLATTESRNQVNAGEQSGL